MKIVARKIAGGAVAAVAAAGLMFATSAPAEAVTDHEHCLLTPDGYVVIAAGISEVTTAPALEMFHEYVHTGEPGEQLTIKRIAVGGECPAEDIPQVVASAG
jgi:hypothetical protein